MLLAFFIPLWWTSTFLASFGYSFTLRNCGHVGLSDVFPPYWDMDTRNIGSFLSQDHKNKYLMSKSNKNIKTFLCGFGCDYFLALTDCVFHTQFTCLFMINSRVYLH